MAMHSIAGMAASISANLKRIAKEKRLGINYYFLASN